MKLLITIVLALLAAVLIGLVASHNEGYLVFSLGEYTIQTSANFFIVLALLLFGFTYIAIRILSRLFSMRKDYGKYREKKDAVRSAKYLNQGMTALIEGDWSKAEKTLKKGALYSDNPSLNYLAAARAAQQQGAPERRDEYLKLAHGSGDSTPLAVGITQAKLQLDQKQDEQALATLNNLYIENPEQPEVKRLLLKSYLDMKDWEGVIHLLPELKKQRILTADSISAYEYQAYAGMLERAGEMENPQQLSKVWLSIPKKMRSELFLIDVYVQQRLKKEKHEDSEILLRKTLKKKFDDRLVYLYGLVNGNDLPSQLTFAENQLKQYPRNATLLMTLGRLCIKSKLWGKAREYFEQCAEVQPGPEVFYELARLLKQMDEPQLASDYNQKGLELATQKAARVDLKLLPDSSDIIENY